MNTTNVVTIVRVILRAGQKHLGGASMNLLTQETCPLSEDIRLISLTQGQFAIVWASDYDWLMQWKWYARWNPCTKSFYAVRNQYIPGKKGVHRQIQVQMARQILGLEYGDKRHADHIYHNTLDNRRSELRILAHGPSMCNRGRFSSNTSGFKGVYWRPPRNGRAGYWIASIQINKKRIERSSSTPEGAYAKYCEMAKLFHGEHAWVK